MTITEQIKEQATSISKYECVQGHVQHNYLSFMGSIILQSKAYPRKNMKIMHLKNLVFTRKKL